MLTWGFILLVAGLLASLGFFFSEMSDVFSVIGNAGFGRYVEAFFDPAKLTTQKVMFVILSALAVLGLVLYIIGRIQNKKNGAEKNTVIPSKVSKYLRDTKGEFKKIVWPNFPTVVKNTGVVLAMCAVTALVICLADFGLAALIKLLLGN